MKVLSIVFFLVFSIAPARADDFTITIAPGLSGNFTAMTDYISRGLSQTNGKPAGNLSENYQFDNGVFVALSAVNTKEGNGNVESDISAGYRTKLSDAWLFQTDVYYTTYPGSSNFANTSYLEFQNIVNYVQDWGKIVAAFAFQPQGQNHAGFYTYTSGGVDFNLPYDFTLGFRGGLNTNAIHSHPNYLDWTVVVSRPITSWAFWSVQYTGSTDYVDAGNGERVVGLISISF